MRIFPRLQAHIDAALAKPDEEPAAQRIAGSTLPATEDTAEAVSDRAARHIEMEG